MKAYWNKKNWKRDGMIIKAYSNGISVKLIAAHYKISIQRTYAILAKGGK